MTIAPRANRPPRSVVGMWMVSLALGAAATVLAVADDSAGSAAGGGLAPTTVTSVLERMAPASAREIRINNLYGSATDSAWQFQAHVTWRDEDGVLHGGATLLPQMAGLPLRPSEFSPAKLLEEERISVTPAALAEVLKELDVPDSGVQLVEYAPTPGAAERVVRHCVAPRAGAGTCRRVTAQGVGSAAAAMLRVVPGREARTVIATAR